MFRANSQIGQYTLVKKLGKGGFGEVWLAEKSSQFFTKKVAVKLPHDEQVDFETIRREAQLWEEASGHPNVLPIIDADVYDGQVVIVSEYAEGGSLSDKLKAEGKFPVKQAVEMATGILNGLDFLHNKKIIHRDIKPQNVLLQGDTPRLADFGISRAMNTSTISSVVIGTDAYMSPEAFDGKRNVRTDIWSVGVVLYQLLKGSLPFPQEHPSERMYAVLTKQFEPLPDEIPSELRRILQQALVKNPNERYQSAAVMREELRNFSANFLSQQSQANQPTAVLPLPVTQPNAQPAYFTPQEIDNQSIVTKFSAAQHQTAQTVVKSTDPPFVNANRNSSIRKTIIGSAAGVILVGLLVTAIIAGLISMSDKSSNTQSSNTISNSANVIDSGAMNNVNSVVNSSTDDNLIANSSTDDNSYSNTNNAVVTLNANTIYATNTKPLDSRSGGNYNSGRTSDTTYSESTRTSNSSYFNTSRMSNPEAPKPKRTNNSDYGDDTDIRTSTPDDEPHIRTTNPSETTVVTTTRNPDGRKATSPANVRRGEIPPEVYNELLKNIRRNQESTNSKKP